MVSRGQVMGWKEAAARWIWHLRRYRFNQLHIVINVWVKAGLRLGALSHLGPPTERAWGSQLHKEEALRVSESSLCLNSRCSQLQGFYCRIPALCLGTAEYPFLYTGWG